MFRSQSIDRAAAFRVSTTFLGGLMLAGLLAAPARSSTFDVSIVCPPPVAVECRSDVPAGATTAQEFIDQGGSITNPCGGGLRIDFRDVSSGECPETITRTYEVSDECGTSTTCDQVITVWDVTAPSINTCPEGATLECGVGVKVRVDADDNCDTALEYDASVTGTGVGNVSVVNNGDGSFTITINGTADVEITFTATDDCGNSDKCTASYRATCEVAEGCTPGFWKNHTKRWDSASDPAAAAAGFTTTTSFNGFFGVTAAQSKFTDGTTMLKAISTGGGSGNNNANLARHAIAGLLSIGAGLNYQFPAGIHNATELIAAVNTAYTTGNFGTLAGDLAKANEAGCPLN